MKKRLFVAALAFMLLLSSCGGEAPEGQTVGATEQASTAKMAAEADSLALYPAAVNLPVGRELKLKATLFPTGASSQWTSSDTAVVTVDGDGMITAKAPGTCTVTVMSGQKSAECAVLVEEDCRTVIFATKPLKGDGENPPQPPEGSEPGEPPIELPPDVSDVDKIPQSDEFVWTLEFDETFSTLVTNDGIPLIVDVAISLKVEKQGGKTGIGSYTGAFSGDADLDKENFIKVMNERMNGQGGKLTDYTENDEGLQAEGITVEVTTMDDEAYHEVLMGHIPLAERSVTQQLPIPISDLFPDAMMALGEVGGMMTISGSMTIEAMGQSISAPFGATGNNAQPYTICIYPSGSAMLTFPLMERDGFARNWVEGMLTKRPVG